MLTLSSANGWGTYGEGHLAANSLGDLFFVDQQYSKGYYIPHGTTTPVLLISSLSGGRNVYVDASDNAYFPSTYSGYVVKIPYSSGGYTTGTALSSVTANCTATATTPCRAFAPSSMTSSSFISGYYQPTDLGIDGSGNVYVLESSDSTGTTGNKIVKLVPVSTSGTLTYSGSFLVTFTTAAVSSEIAVDSAGDVYYTNKTTLYTIPAGSTTASTFGSYTTPAGVSVDRFGNVFVTDSSTKYSFYEFPAVNGVANTSVQYTAFYGYSANGIAFDGHGHFFSTGYSSGNTLNKNSIFGYDFGSAAVGTSLGTQTFTLTFTGSYTPTTYMMSTNSPSAFTYTAGTCVAGTAVSQGSNCTVRISYTPSAVGLQKGELVLLDSSGNQIGAVPVSGTGTGAIQTIDPGVQSSVGSGWVSPQGIDVDATGAIYVADSGANAVQRYASATDTAPTSPGTGLSAPTDVKVDAAGNVYIADSGNGRIVKVPVVAGSLSNSSQSVLYSGISSQTGLALDRNNNLYIADRGNARVLEIAAAGGFPNASYIKTIGSGFVDPVAVATDSSGNVYVVDQGNASSNDVTEVVSAGGALNTIGTGYSTPSGVAVDASGSVYVADTNNYRLLKVPSEGGSINANDATTVGGTLSTPHGVALDATGNLYITDTANAAVALISRTQGVLSLGSANLGTTTATQAAEISNAGNSTLTLGTPAYTETGSSSYFTITTSQTGGCTAALALASGSACTVDGSFSPTVTGSYSDVLTFSSNATNSASSTLTFTGKGTYIAPTTLGLTQTSPSGTPVFGDSITISAALSYTANGSAIPSGTITFFLDSVQYKQPVSISNNTATITLSQITAGAHTIGASYSGDDSYASSSATTISLTIDKITSSTSFTFTGTSSNPVSAAPNTALTYTATITYSSSVSPTGTVSFYSGTTLLGSGNVSTSNSVSTATLTTTSTPTGIDSITAVYNGDVNYNGSTSAAQSIDITPTAFTVSTSASTLSVADGATGSVTLTITSYSGYGGNIAFTCSGLPAYTTCSFNPDTFSLVSGTPQTVVAQFITTQAVTQTPSPVGYLKQSGRFMHEIAPVAFAMLIPFGLLGIVRSRKSLHRLTGISLLAIALAACAGCFSGCSSTLSHVAPKGTYSVTITAYGTTTTYVTTQQTSTVTLTVQ